MTTIADLFEPKLPPINLWCMTPASWFYRNETLTFPEKQVKEREDTFSVFKKQLSDARANK